MQLGVTLTPILAPAKPPSHLIFPTPVIISAKVRYALIIPNLLCSLSFSLLRANNLTCDSYFYQHSTLPQQPLFFLPHQFFLPRYFSSIHLTFRLIFPSYASRSLSSSTSITKFINFTEPIKTRNIRQNFIIILFNMIVFFPFFVFFLDKYAYQQNKTKKTY